MRALWGLDRAWVGTKEQPGLTGRGIKSQPFSHLCAKPPWKNNLESGGETTDHFCSVSMAELTPQAPGRSGRDLRCSQASLTEPLTEASPLPLRSLLCCSRQDTPHTEPRAFLSSPKECELSAEARPRAPTEAGLCTQFTVASQNSGPGLVKMREPGPKEVPRPR